MGKRYKPEITDPALVRDDKDYLDSNRHFTTEGYKNIRSLMARIGEGDLSARDPFLKAITPFVDRTAKRIAGQVYGEQADEERVKELVQDVLMELVLDPKYFKGSARSWTNFNKEVQLDLRKKFTDDKENDDKQRTAFIKLSADGTASRKHDPQVTYAGKELKTVLADAAENLTQQQRHLISLRYGLGTNSDHGLEEISKLTGWPNEKVTSTERKAMRKLRNPQRLDRLRAFLDNDDVLVPVSDTSMHHKRSFTANADGVSWQERPEPYYRNAIRSLFKHSNGAEYSDSELKNTLRLNNEQWHAFMEARLSHDRESCQTLVKDRMEITRKLTEGLSSMFDTLNMRDDTDDRYNAHSHLTTNIAGIMALAHKNSVVVNTDVAPEHASSLIANTEDASWQGKVRPESYYRDAIRSFFKRSDGASYSDTELKEIFTLNDKQWHALMEARLSHDSDSCQTLEEDGLEITKKLAGGLSRLSSALNLRDNPDSMYKAHTQLTTNIAGIMALAHKHRTTQLG